MATFKSTATRNLGNTVLTIHTAVSNSVVIGLNAANIYPSELPINIWHRRSGVDTYIIKEYRVGPGKTEELMRGNKIVLQTGDTLRASTALEDGFDILVSVLEGV
jgi:hypothetical protein